MKNRTFFCVILCALLTCLLPISAMAFNHYAIDVEALKALEQTDNFEVKVTKKTVTDGANSGSFNLKDILSLSIDNLSSKDVKQITVLVVCYDDEKLAQELQPSGGIVMGSPREKRMLWSSTYDKLSIPAGGSFQVNIECRHSDFSGARALVAQYVNQDGETFINPIYEQWQELALGSPTHILD